MKPTKTYIGERIDGEAEVYVRTSDGKEYPLPLRQEIRNHSPTGFSWGYDGSGPAQLALAILADHFSQAPAPPSCPYCHTDMTSWRCFACGYDGEREGDAWLAFTQPGPTHYQQFKSTFVAQIKTERFELTTDQIDAWLRRVSLT